MYFKVSSFVFCNFFTILLLWDLKWKLIFNPVFKSPDLFCFKYSFPDQGHLLYLFFFLYCSLFPLHLECSFCICVCFKNGSLLIFRTSSTAGSRVFVTDGLVLVSALYVHILSVYLCGLSSFYFFRMSLLVSCSVCWSSWSLDLLWTPLTHLIRPIPTHQSSSSRSTWD